MASALSSGIQTTSGPSGPPPGYGRISRYASIGYLEDLSRIPQIPSEHKRTLRRTFYIVARCQVEFLPIVVKDEHCSVTQIRREKAGIDPKRSSEVTWAECLNRRVKRYNAIIADEGQDSCPIGGRHWKALFVMTGGAQPPEFIHGTTVDEQRSSPRIFIPR